MRKFYVWGSMPVSVEFEIEAESQEAAEKLVKEILTDELHVGANGGKIESADFSTLFVDEL